MCRCCDVHGEHSGVACRSFLSIRLHVSAAEQVWRHADDSIKREVQQIHVSALGSMPNVRHSTSTSPDKDG